jgi:hypothetical protein
VTLTWQSIPVAGQKLKSNPVKYLIKAFKCGESELCQRAIDIDAACKVGGPIREVRGFHSKLLAQFASNAQCAITVMRLSDDKSETATKNNLEAYKRANWELNLGFTPGAMKQTWALWPWEPGKGISPAGVRRRRSCADRQRCLHYSDTWRS